MPLGRILRGAAIALGLAALLTPERARDRAERSLQPATQALRFLDARPQDVPDREGALARIARIAEEAAPSLPGDPRPLVLGGLAHLRARQPEKAVALLEQALALEERAEVDMHLAAAYGALGDRAKASAAILRAAWISPVLVAVMPFSREEKHEIYSELTRLEHDFRAGRMKEPPPRP